MNVLLQKIRGLKMTLDSSAHRLQVNQKRVVAIHTWDQRKAVGEEGGEGERGRGRGEGKDEEGKDKRQNKILRTQLVVGSRSTIRLEDFSDFQLLENRKENIRLHS